MKLNREKCVWEVKRLKSIERDQGEQIRNRKARIYRNLIKLNRPRAIERYRALKRPVLAIELAIEDLTRGFLNNEARWIEVAIEELSRRQKVSQWIELAIESYREGDKKKLKGLNRQLICQELSRLLKNSFSKKRKTQI